MYLGGQWQRWTDLLVRGAITWVPDFEMAAFRYALTQFPVRSADGNACAGCPCCRSSLVGVNL